MMGSPLKRSFTAAVEDGYGLRYLKRRRGEGEMGFGPVVRRELEGGSRARSVPEGMAVREYSCHCAARLCWDLDICG